MRTAHLFIDGKWREGASAYELLDKFDGRLIAEIAVPNAAMVTEALDALVQSQSSICLTNNERSDTLREASSLLSQRRSEFEESIVADTGFTFADAAGEVSRAVETLLLCAEQARQLTGHTVPIDGGRGMRGRIAFTLRRPLGLVCAITPFNSPLNTVCHKVGPALAAGNAVLLKPSPDTPLTAALLFEILLEAGVPSGLLGLLSGGSEVGRLLVASPQPMFYAFTGSTSAGEEIARGAGRRRVQMEMGSLSSTIVCADADLDRAADLCVTAGFRKAGQVCTSVQRLYVEGAVAGEFVETLVNRVGRLSAGDPRAPGTSVGPVISLESAERIESWIKEALDFGATLAIGGTRTGSVISPTVVQGAPMGTRLLNSEVFGPVVAVRVFDSYPDAITEVNDTPFGLAAGVFTGSMDRALIAIERLNVGVVHINETSSNRADLMPFGGVKASGLGKEGPKYAIEAMTEEKLVTIGRSAW